MKIALGQFNAVLGDFEANAERMRQDYRRALDAGADILVFPEMSLCGYPPEDLLLRKNFLEENRGVLNVLAAEFTGLTVITGFAEFNDEECFNSLAVLRRGKVETIYRKIILPNYEVFDEKRYFETGSNAVFLEQDGMNILLTVCEDIWQLQKLDKHFPAGSDNIDIVINISASPFHFGKIDLRMRVLERCARHFSAAVAYCNLIGGQDELIFDGRSMFVDSAGRLISRAKAFNEDMIIADFTKNPDGKVNTQSIRSFVDMPSDRIERPESEIYEALVLGTRDYITKNGFSKVLIGLSGGIDSSITAAVAVDALGPENVIGVTMPSKFNTAETITDAEKLAQNLNIEFHTLAIADILDSFDNMLANVPGWDDKGLAYENLQARIRGTLLMSLSNQFSAIVLTTGNKSETAVGYSTLYGDTAGGFAVIKDVFKTMVYRLSEYVNERAQREIIPQSVITRPPSAELRADQKDTDSLPDYDLLDSILRGYVEQDKSIAALISEGLDEKNVRRIARLVDLNEYKRRQSPPGIRITAKAFGKDRRMPITNRYRSG